MVFFASFFSACARKSRASSLPVWSEAEHPAIQPFQVRTSAVLLFAAQCRARSIDNEAPNSLAEAILALEHGHGAYCTCAGTDTVTRRSVPHVRSHCSYAGWVTIHLRPSRMPGIMPCSSIAYTARRPIPKRWAISDTAIRFFVVITLVQFLLMLWAITEEGLVPPELLRTTRIRAKTDERTSWTSRVDPRLPSDSAPY